MSNLEDFTNHAMACKPNAVHGRAGRETHGAKQAPPCPPHARRDRAAKASGQLHGALYYTQAQQTCGEAGVWESEETVRHKLLSKEEFPYG